MIRARRETTDEGEDANRRFFRPDGGFVGQGTEDGLWASPEEGARPTNQSKRPVLTFDTTLKYAVVLLSSS